MASLSGGCVLGITISWLPHVALCAKYEPMNIAYEALSRVLPITLRGVLATRLLALGQQHDVKQRKVLYFAHSLCYVLQMEYFCSRSTSSITSLQLIPPYSSITSSY